MDQLIEVSRYDLVPEEYYVILQRKLDTGEEFPLYHRKFIKRMPNDHNGEVYCFSNPDENMQLNANNTSLTTCNGQKIKFFFPEFADELWLIEPEEIARFYKLPGPPLSSTHKSNIKKMHHRFKTRRLSKTMRGIMKKPHIPMDIVRHTAKYVSNGGKKLTRFFKKKRNGANNKLN